MPAYGYGVGKGLIEPCLPGRKAYFFGAELNAVEADNWNCLPDVVDATKDFNLSTLSKNREVVVALLRISNASEGTYNIKFSLFNGLKVRIYFVFEGVLSLLSYNIPCRIEILYF